MDGLPGSRQPLPDPIGGAAPEEQVRPRRVQDEHYASRWRRITSAEEPFIAEPARPGDARCHAELITRRAADALDERGASREDEARLEPDRGTRRLDLRRYDAATP